MPFPLAATMAIASSPIVQTVAQGVIGGQMSDSSYHNNKKLVQEQARLNQAYQDAQNAYNSPLNQRQRMEAAGFNPNLFYGQGNPGNQSTPLQHPGFKPKDLSWMMELIPTLNQSRMVNSQISAQEAATNRSIAQTELTKVQTQVASANPYLDKDYFNALVDQMKSAASIKNNEMRMSDVSRQWFTAQDKNGNAAGARKMEIELKLLEQRFDLGTSDQKIKAEIFKSQEFKNSLLEIQNRFLKDADVTPGQWLQFLSMVILKAM